MKSHLFLCTILVFLYCCGSDSNTYEDIMPGDYGNKTDSAAEQDVQGTDTAISEEIKQCSNTCETPDSKECTKTSDKSYRECKLVNGCLQWSGEKTCGSTQKCEGNECVEIPCPEEKACKTLDDKKCDSNSVFECKAVNNCLEWVLKETCTEKQTCEQGQCKDKPVEGTLDCIGVMQCATACSTTDMTCINACTAKGTVQGQAEFKAFTECTQKNCGSPSESGTFQKCVLVNCKESFLKCNPPLGIANCKTSLSCVQACSSDKTCQKGCIDKATYEAVLLLIDVRICIEAKCPDESFICIGMNCMAEINKCNQS
jgi:hypothetical protein